MKQVTTPNGYLVIERIGGLDVFMEDHLVCEICGKTFADYSYDEKVNTDKLDNDILEELDTLNVIEKITDPFNVL